MCAELWLVSPELPSGEEEIWDDPNSGDINLNSVLDCLFGIVSLFPSPLMGEGLGEGEKGVG
jgi:hypothetical protein